MEGPAAVQQLMLAEGRTLAYAVLGAPLAGCQLACIYHHGVPSSLIEAEPLAEAAAALGVAVVAFDRPGMGGSTFYPRMCMASVVNDTMQLMDHLQLTSCVHVGESGGAPYAAACAALHPTRVQQVLLLAGLAATHGRDKAHLRRALNAMDRYTMNAGRLGLGAGWAINRLVKLAADRKPEAVKRGAGASLGPCDAQYLEGNQKSKDWLVQFMQRAYAGGVRGVLRDYKVLGSDWGLDVGTIRCRVAIWQGAGDQVVTPAHADWWQAAVPGSQLRLVEGEGHISLVGRHGAAIVRDALESGGAQGGGGDSGGGGLLSASLEA